MRKKKPANETVEERQIREIMEGISSSSTRNEKISWNRKRKNMDKLIEKLKVPEEKILEIIKNEKYPIMDEMETLRQVMVAECIHPDEYMVIDPDYSHAVCKFCQKKIRIQ